MRRKLCLLGLSISILALTGCEKKSQLLDMINRGEQIEIEVAVPANVEQGEESQIVWEILANATTNETLRNEWDDLLLITRTNTGKNGVLYVNTQGENENNNTLRVALHNRAFAQSLENEDSLENLAVAAMNQYADIEAEETMKAVYMGINGYFNLLPDATPNYSNPDSTLERAEFMAMVMRADTPVSELESNGLLTNAVGQNDYNLYAQDVVKNSYLDLESKSLNNKTYNGSITRAEALYMLVSRYYSEELSLVDLKATDIKFSDATDGGNIAEQQKFIENGVAKDYWKSYELTYALQNPNKGLPTELYKALVVAQQVGIMDTTETRWDEAITKAEAVEFIMEALKHDDSIEIFNATVGTIDGYTIENENNVSELPVLTPEEKEAAESKAMDDFLNTTPVVNDKEVTIENCEVSIGTNGYPVYGTQSNPLTVKPDVSQLKSGDQYWFRTWSGEVVLEIYSNADFW